MAFICVIRVVRILYVEYRDFCGCNICYILEVVRCSFYMRGTKIFAFCKRIRLKRIKIWWGINVENFALESVYAVLRTWIGYEQRFLL